MSKELSPKRVMDFGCGTGMSLSLLADILKAEQVIGLDPSEESLAVARESVGNQHVRLATPASYLPQQDLDLVFCNGVFHHIPEADRPAAMNYVYRCLRPGGLFAMWENNPWNPIQSFAMKHSEIDRNAIATLRHRSLASSSLRSVSSDSNRLSVFLPGLFYLASSAGEKSDQDATGRSVSGSRPERLTMRTGLSLGKRATEEPRRWRHCMPDNAETAGAEPDGGIEHLMPGNRGA